MKTRSHALGALMLIFPLLALAQAPPAPTFARGSIAAIDADSLTIKGENGTTTKYAFGNQSTVTVLKPVSIDAIQAGSFIGTAEMPQKDGTGRSLEVHVFPPGQKAGEGHYPWDKKPGSMMTNGTVGKVTTTAKGRELEVSYPNGERKVVVPKNVPIVQFTSGTRADLKPNIPAFVVVIQTPNGPAAVNVAIGENGAKPPM
jgi:hypothetical protein